MMSPFILYSDGEGNIFEDNSLFACGRSGWDAIPVDDTEWIKLPEGGSLYELPGRRGIGVDVDTGAMRLCEKGWAVAAFIPPAHTGLYLAAYETGPDAPTLPLFCYTAAGWFNEKFYVPAVRIEPDIRQESSGYNASDIEEGAESLLRAYPDNRLVKHLMENCCNTYHCPGCQEFIAGPLGMPCSCFTCLQCKLHRLYFIPAPGGNYSLHTGPVNLSSGGRRNCRIHRSAFADRAFPDHQFRTGL